MPPPSIVRTCTCVQYFVVITVRITVVRTHVGWLGLGLTALSDSISVYIGPSPKEREREERKEGTGSLPRAIARPGHPRTNART